MTMFIVTEDAMRPASAERQCFYCREPIGGNHKAECVLVSKKVTVRMTVEYDIDVPAHWSADLIEFSRNDGSWCASNMIEELNVLDEEDCLCSRTHFTYLQDASAPFVKEK